MDAAENSIDLLPGGKANSVEKMFLDSNEPALPQAAEILRQRFAVRGNDYRDVVVVVPGRRAGRRLLELLIAQTGEGAEVVVPPQIETVGTFAELLYEAKRPFATPLTQRLTWLKCLKQAGKSHIERIAAAVPPEDDLRRWLGLADLLMVRHTELAADGLDFEAVARRTAHLGEDAESDRWESLRHVQRQYLGALDELGLWDRQTARLFAIEHQQCHTDRQIVLLGTVDLNRATRQMLAQVHENVLALVHAHVDHHDHFDAFGCLVPDAWSNVAIDVSDDSIRVAEGPADQADEAMNLVAESASWRRPEQITLGVPDERLVPHIKRAGAVSGVPVRYGPGKPMAQSAPYRLFAAFARWLQSGRFADFSALVRHADMQEYFRQRKFRSDYLSALDRYQNERLPVQFLCDEKVEWPTATGKGKSRNLHKIEKLRQLTAALIKPFQGERQQQRLATWSRPLASVIRRIYGRRVFDRDKDEHRQTYAACNAMIAVLEEWVASVPARVEPWITIHQAIEMLLDQIAREMIPDPPDNEAVELVGWLELALDDAELVVVSSMNEEFVPESASPDLLLPDALRRQLGLVDNARRFARDAYVLTNLVASRDDYALIVGRRDDEGDPLRPSRLLFLSDAETIHRRSKQFFRETPEAPPRREFVGGNLPPRDRMGFDYLRPRPLQEPLERLSVTAFKDYLACKYRFYLKHVLKARAEADDADELDPLAFGHLIHEVLDVFGRGKLRHSEDAEEIRKALSRALDREVEQRYGRRLSGAVAVQVEQARMRLAAFAEKQAQRCADGWKIVHSERKISGGDALLYVDGEPFELSGKVDRIDRHEATGVWAVLDYKTSNKADRPEATHVKRKEWVDLQLPLYRYLVQSVGMEGQVELGYVALPGDSSATDFFMARWSDEELAQADETAKRVIRQIRNEEFWPPADPAPSFSEELAPLCMDGVFGRPPFEAIEVEAEKQEKRGEMNPPHFQKRASAVNRE